MTQRADGDCFFCENSIPDDTGICKKCIRCSRNYFDLFKRKPKRPSLKGLDGADDALLGLRE